MVVLRLQPISLRGNLFEEHTIAPFGNPVNCKWFLATEWSICVQNRPAKYNKHGLQIRTIVGVFGAWVLKSDLFPKNSQKIMF